MDQARRLPGLHGRRTGRQRHALGPAALQEQGRRHEPRDAVVRCIRLAASVRRRRQPAVLRRRDARQRHQPAAQAGARLRLEHRGGLPPRDHQHGRHSAVRRQGPPRRRQGRRHSRARSKDARCAVCVCSWSLHENAHVGRNWHVWVGERRRRGRGRCCSC